MRIIGGKNKGKNLKAPTDDYTRPTSDKTRSALFNIIQSDFLKKSKNWSDIVFLDVFSGTGAVGVEALSRGAKKVFFMENHLPAIDCIKANTKGYGNAFILSGDACCPPFQTEAVNVMFMDAPYASQLWETSLSELKKKGWINADSFLVVEVERKEEVVIPAGFKLCDDRTYGRNRLLLCQIPPTEPPIHFENKEL